MNTSPTSRPTSRPTINHDDDGPDCVMSFDEWFKEFHAVARRAHGDPQYLNCTCGRPFRYYTVGTERFMFAGELEGTVRILAERCAASDTD